MEEAAGEMPASPQYTVGVDIATKNCKLHTANY